MDDQSDSNETQPPQGTIFSAYRRTQALVILAAVLCFLLFWWGGAWAGVPAQPGFQGSLLQQRNWPLAMLAAYVMLACSVVVGTLIAGRSWFFAGLFTATVGLMALAARGGPARFVLFDAAAHGGAQTVFLNLLAEQCLLFLAIAIIWSFFWRRYLRILPGGESGDKEESTFMSIAMPVFSQAAILAFLVLLLVPTDVQKQVLIGLFIAGFAATSLAESLVPHPKAGGWYWVGPFLVGMAGYLLAYFHGAPWTTGAATGPLAALAHPLPLDYASAGAAGALLGYWIGGARANAPFRLLGSARRPTSSAVPAERPQTDGGPLQKN